MNTLFNKLSIFVAIIIIGLSACVQENFDEPPVFTQVDVAPQYVRTVGEIIAMSPAPSNPVLITDSIFIHGIVVSSDEAGNFYKSLVIQDVATNEGISISADKTSMFRIYPVGREVYVYLKGLYIGNFEGLPTIGGGLDEDDPEFVSRIADALVTEHVLKDSLREAVPVELSIADFYGTNPNNYLNRLVTFTDVEFTSDLQNAVYADGEFGSDRYFENCNGQQINARMSAFASFASQQIPTGNGKITGVLSYYRSDYQFIIRDENDVALDSPRCDAQLGIILRKDFEDNNLTSGGWSSVATEGPYNWRVSNLGGGNSYYGIMSNYNQGSNTASQVWLVSPSLDLTTANAPNLEFRNAFNFGGPVLELFVSTDYDGDTQANIETDYTWTPLSFNVSSGSFAWADADVDLSAYAGESNVYFAFKYTGTNNNGSTWEVDDIVVKGN